MLPMALRFKLDENIPVRVLSTLRAQGHDVETAESEGLAGAADAEILAACIAEDRILVTLDLTSLTFEGTRLDLTKAFGFYLRRNRPSMPWCHR